nr:hypothetical protein CFP56_77105 [Quercus suber]
MVNKRDAEDFNRFMAQRSNSGMTPYEGINVLEDSFCNSAVVAEGNKAKQSRDDYDGAGPSGEGSSNDIPNPKRIEWLTEFMIHGKATSKVDQLFSLDYLFLKFSRPSSDHDQEQLMGHHPTLLG